MHQEIEPLIQAIESLRQDVNPFKDYVYPIISGILSSLLGAGVAYLTLRHQDNIQIEKEKLNTVNDWMLLAESAFATLVTFKTNYYKKIDSNPFQRALTIRSIIHISNKIDKNISSLSFIVPKKEDEKSLNIKWRNIPRIRTMVNNYNYILDLWEKRNEIERPIKEKLLQDHSSQTSYADVNSKDILNSIGATKITSLIDITEQLIKLTDDLLIEIDDFMSEFTGYKPIFITEPELAGKGGSLKYVTSYIEEEAKSPKWLDLQVKANQYQLF